MNRQDKIKKTAILYRSLFQKYEQYRSLAMNSNNIDDLKKNWAKSNNYFLLSLRAETLSYRLCTPNVL